MSQQYDHLMGEEQDAKSHPDTRLAGDVIPMRNPANDNKNLDLGTGGFDVDAAWNSLRKEMSKPTLTVIPGGKKD